MYVLIDHYTPLSDYLYRMLSSVEPDLTFLVLDDSCFLPAGFFPFFEFAIRHLTKQEGKDTPAFHPVFNIFLPIPQFWSITPVSRASAQISYHQTVRGKIYYKEPYSELCVNHVEWLSETGTLYRTDYYDRYGHIAYQDFWNSSHTLITRTYYSQAQQEILSYNDSTGSYAIIQNGCIQSFFENRNDFLVYFLKYLNTKNETVIATTNDQISLLKQSDVWEHTNHLILYDRISEAQTFLQQENVHISPAFLLNTTATKALLSTPDPRLHMIHYVPDISFTKYYSKHQILILTASDQIEGLAELVTALPNVFFHIAANTAVSDYLMSFQEFDNVSVYQQISSETLQLLLQNCTIYLDINYGPEIHDALIQASMNHLLLLGFSDTIHNASYLLPEFVFPQGNVTDLLNQLHLLTVNETLYRSELKKQQALHLQDLSLLTTALKK